MRDCKRHPSESQPGGGVCASCLRERLTWLWRGESFRLDDPENSLPEVPLVRDDACALASQSEGVGSVASVRKELEVNGVATGGFFPQISSDDVRHGDHSVGAVIVVPSLGDRLDGDAASGNPTVVPHQNSQSTSRDIIVEWTEFHARRRRTLELLELNSPNTKSRSFDSLEIKPSVDVVMDIGNAHRASGERSSHVRILMSAQKLRTRSMPLDNRIAEDTASRVIREQADVLYLDDLDYLEGLQERDGGGGITLQSSGREQTSPAWQARKSPKWLRVLISPVTSRNKVFPSRSKEDVRKGRGSRKRLTRFASSDWSHTDADGGSSLHWMDALRIKEEMSEGYRRTTRLSSVFSWLQQASERTEFKESDQTRQLTSSFSTSAMNSESTDTVLRDLITVGHLHEIAEEIEEEDEVLTDAVDDIASFGKFLLIAAQKQPKAGLTRLSSATSI